MLGDAGSDREGAFVIEEIIIRNCGLTRVCELRKESRDDLWNSKQMPVNIAARAPS